MLLEACREHRAGLSEGGCRCFRCDFEAVGSGCLEPRPQLAPASQRASSAAVEKDAVEAFEAGDRVVLCGLGRDDLNGKEGLIMSPARPGDGAEEDGGRCSVRLEGSMGTKAVRPQNLALRSRAPVGPREVARWLPKLGEEFTFGAQEDAHEFLRSLLRLVEDEEVKEHAEALRRREAGTVAAALPAVNADLTASPSRVFGGLLVSQCTCTNRKCGASSFSYERFMDLQINVTEFTDSVEDALRLFTAPERLDKKNSWRCETCSETVRARKQMTIYSAPNVLVLQLQRAWMNNKKVTRPLAFSSELNLRPFLCAGSPEGGRPLLYELRAVIVHLDKAGFSHFGHYVAYVRCKTPGTGATQRWFLMDDSVATEVSEQEVLRQQAYLLLYARLASASSTGAFVAEVASRRAADGGAEAVQPTSKCRGRNGAVCSFFACSDGLCTRCYQEEHGRPPPSASAVSAVGKEAASISATTVAPEPAKPAPGAAAQGKPAPKKASAAPAPSPSGGKAKKVGPNEMCPCGSGKKYKKCHGGS